MLFPISVASYSGCPIQGICPKSGSSSKIKAIRSCRRTEAQPFSQQKQALRNIRRTRFDYNGGIKVAFEKLVNTSFEVPMKKNEHRDHLKSVEISCLAPDAQEVSVGGTFNGWDPTRAPMSRTADGTWHITLKLEPGTYEYKFLVDGNWCCKPGVDESDPQLLDSADCVPNVFGSMNRKLEV